MIASNQVERACGSGTAVRPRSTLFHVDGNGTMTSWPVLTGSMFQNEQALSRNRSSGRGTSGSA